MHNKRFDWVNAVFLTVTPIGAVVGGILYTRAYGFALSDLIAFGIMYVLTGLAITAGYHRYYAHRAYQCNRFVQLMFLLFGAASFQNSVLSWGSDHRQHHREVDTNEDPYNINKGFFWAHMGWIFFSDLKGEQSIPFSPDFKKDKLVMWQHKYCLPLSVLVSVGVPLLVGLAFGRVGGALIWGTLIRLVLTHHATFLINSAAHVWGRRPYSLDNTARDSALLAVASFGEGYHNFHHAFQADYRNGIAWYHWDPSKWLISSLAQVGAAWNLRRTSDETIERAAERVRLTLLTGGKPAIAPVADFDERVVDRMSEMMAEVEAMTYRESSVAQAR